MKTDCTRSEIKIFKYVYCNFLGTFFEAELTIECYKYILVCFFNTVHNYGATWLIAALKIWLRRVPCDKNVSGNFAALQSVNRLASKLNNLYLFMLLWICFQLYQACWLPHCEYHACPSSKLCSNSAKLFGGTTTAHTHPCANPGNKWRNGARRETRRRGYRAKGIASIHRLWFYNLLTIVEVSS